LFVLISGETEARVDVPSAGAASRRTLSVQAAR
jgi:hypothetical protein